MAMSNELQARLLKALPKPFSGMTSLPIEQLLILTGNTFKAEILFTLANTVVKLLYFETPADFDVLWASDFINSDSSGVQYRLLEDTTWTGTVVQPVIAQNRQSGIEAQSLLYNTATGYDDAGSTEIDLIVLLGGVGVGGSQFGSGQKGSDFIVLKRSTKYTLEITNNSGGSADIVVKSRFAETDLTD